MYRSFRFTRVIPSAFLCVAWVSLGWLPPWNAMVQNAMAQEVEPDARSLAVPQDDDPEYEVDPEIKAELEEWNRQMRAIADAHGPPPGTKQLTKLPDLWVDMKAKRVYLDGYVTIRRGGLEMFACPVGTKEHESVVAAFAKSKEVHAALLAVGTKVGKPVSYDPKFEPPTGQSVAVWVMWRNKAGEFQVADARTWIQNVKTNQSLAEQWVFAGSQIWTDPVDNTSHYSADSGDMICVSNFSSAMLDVPFDSSAQADNLLFVPFTDRIPEEATPIRLVLVPLTEGDETTNSKPVETMLPLAVKRNEPNKELEIEMKPVEAKPAEPKPTEPKPTEPKPAEPKRP